MFGVKELFEKIDKKAKEKFGPHYRDWSSSNDGPFPGGCFDANPRWQADAVVTAHALENALDRGINSIQDLEKAKKEAELDGNWDYSTTLYSIKCALESQNQADA